MFTPQCTKNASCAFLSKCGQFSTTRFSQTYRTDNIKQCFTRRARRLMRAGRVLVMVADMEERR